MCILLNVKKHEKTFALNVDIFRRESDAKNLLTFNGHFYTMSINAMTKTV